MSTTETTNEATSKSELEIARENRAAHEYDSLAGRYCRLRGWTAETLLRDIEAEERVITTDET